MRSSRRSTLRAAARSALAAGLLTVTAATVALAAPTASALGFSNGTVATPNIPRCEPDIVVLVPGGGNTVPGLPDNFPVGAYISDLGAMVEKPGRSTSRTVSYNAAPFVATAYTESRSDGIAKTRKLVAKTAAQCPSSTISLAGYSSALTSPRGSLPTSPMVAVRWTQTASAPPRCCRTPPAARRPS